jgi:hypothetical protein
MGKAKRKGQRELPLVHPAVVAAIDIGATMPMAAVGFEAI